MQDSVSYVIQATPWGEMLLAASERGLVSMRFRDQGHPKHWKPGAAQDHAALHQAKTWLQHFSDNPQAQIGPRPQLDERNCTAFELKVWRLLDRIPCGHTTSYAQLAQLLETSPRAVGRAVGSNPWLLLRPCHRVVGTNGALTGYAAGLPRKQHLLAFEANWKS